ncbi:alpha/beta fold hydrolase [Larkinella punicea]|uniref:Alpha/beta hydrolase n=1 Tax=Larkinella punicea TaxID=2315727 RepID=A0A368JJH8_9BACT|nr:alpha/beta hydrolase [Larkinella punicea]RCR67819.1 alpha/beta hydrolase [Larkinella punicea]
MDRKGIIEIQGVWLGFSIEGEGFPALVIGSSIYYPRTFLGTIRQQLQLIFIDHRGFAPPPSDGSKNEEITLDVLLSDIETVRKALSLEYFVIIGHSGHTFLALEYTKKYPQRVSNLVLIGGSPDFSLATAQARSDFFEKEAEIDRKKALEASMAELPDRIAAEPERRFVHLCLATGPLSWYNYRFDATHLWEGVYTNMSVIDHVWGVIFRDIDITRGLAKLTQPVFLALGRYDYLTGTPFLWDQVKSQFHNLTIHIFEESAHTPQFEEADRFNQELIEWFRHQ